MGANAQTSVPAFTAGQVLTAAQVTQINTGIPVFASSTERDAAFGGTGEKTLAEGQMAYLEDVDETQYYDGASWATVGATGLVPISTTTVGTAVSSVTISDCFSADYDHYLVRWSGGVSSTDTDMTLRVGGVTATDYAYALHVFTYAGSESTSATSSLSRVRFMGRADTSFGYVEATILGPFLTQETFFWSPVATTTSAGRCGGYLNDTTSHTSVTVLPNSGTITGGTITVYGYAKA